MRAILSVVVGALALAVPASAAVPAAVGTTSYSWAQPWGSAPAAASTQPTVQWTSPHFTASTAYQWAQPWGAAPAVTHAQPLL